MQLGQQRDVRSIGIPIAIVVIVVKVVKVVKVVMQ
jgi:hypothetical protein